MRLFSPCLAVVMNCLSCHGAMGKVHGQSHHWCCSCDRYEFPTELSEGQVPITSGGESTGFSCPKCEVSLEVGTITDSVQVCFLQQLSRLCHIVSIAWASELANASRLSRGRRPAVADRSTRA